MITFSDNLKSIHHKIQRSVGFLGVLVNKDGCGASRTSIYGTSCDTGQVLHYALGSEVVTGSHALLLRISKKAGANCRSKQKVMHNVEWWDHTLEGTEDIQGWPICVTIPYAKGVRESITCVLSQLNMKTSVGLMLGFVKGPDKPPKGQNASWRCHKPQGKWEHKDIHKSAPKQTQLCEHVSGVDRASILA